MDSKNLRFGLGVAGIGGAIFLALLWQPTRQVRLHQEHLLEAVSERDWEAVDRFIGGEYRDRWGHDKENVLVRAKQVFGQFFLCEMRGDERGIEVLDGRGTIAQRVTLGGTGGPVAEYAEQQVNALTEPFVFKWTQQSWKPWDWALVSVDQPQLVIPDSAGF